MKYTIKSIYETCSTIYCCKPKIILSTVSENKHSYVIPCASKMDVIQYWKLGKCPWDRKFTYFCTIYRTLELIILIIYSDNINTLICPKISLIKNLLKDIEFPHPIKSLLSTYVNIYSVLNQFILQIKILKIFSRI